MRAKLLPMVRASIGWNASGCYTLALGLTLLQLFIAEHGDGDLGEELPADDGSTLRRLPKPHDCRYVSIFGELHITRAVYGCREGQQIERVPLDERLGLPAGDFSYVLEDWAQRFCLKGSFAEAAESLETLLGLRLGSRTLEHMNQELAGFVVPFRDAVEPPPAAEEGPILVVTADGKGVPMRRPVQKGPRRHHRRTKGEKANKKQMACVGAVYSIEPFVRSADDILDEVLRDRRGADRPEPAHKHVWAEMSRDLDGEPLSAKDAVFGALFDDLNLRNAGHDRPVVCLMDGERALWEAQQVYFSAAAWVLGVGPVAEQLGGRGRDARVSPLAPDAHLLADAVDGPVFLDPVLGPIGVEDDLLALFLRAGDRDKVRADPAAFDNLVRDSRIGELEVTPRLQEGGIQDRVFDERVGHRGSLGSEIRSRWPAGSRHAGKRGPSMGEST